MKTVRTIPQMQYVQLRLGTVSPPDMPAGTLSSGYLRIDSYLTHGPAYGRYFGLHFPVVIKDSQHLELDQEAAFFRGSEEILSLNFKSSRISDLPYDIKKDGDEGIIKRDYLFPTSINLDIDIPNIDGYDPDGDETAVVRIGIDRMKRVWRKETVSQLVRVLEEDIGILGFELQPLRMSEGEENFNEALGGFPADFQRKACESKCFDFRNKYFERKKRVAVKARPYIRFVSIPMGGQPKRY